MKRRSVSLGRLPALGLLAPLLFAACGGKPTETAGDESTTASGGGVVNVYSARHYDVDEALYEQFSAETGIEINLLEGDSAGLLERLRREEEASPADVFITVDAGRLHQAELDGIFQSAFSELLEERIPAHLRHPDGLWYGITKRARVIAYAKDRVEAGAIATYEELADPKWRGKVLTRSSSNVYSQSLMGSIIAALGDEAAEEWCDGLVANLAREPTGGDRDQVRAVAAGEADFAIANSYYLGQMKAGSEEDRAVMEQIGVIFPNQGSDEAPGRGTHVNISGAGVVVGAANKENAVRFLEFMTGPAAQSAFANANKEYPVVAGYEIAAELVDFGEFREDELVVSEIGRAGQNALMMMDRCGWR